jgi:hypothetical protein
MKVFPESTLPLQANSFSERYVVYLLETNSKFPAVSLAIVVFGCVMWWVTGVWWYALAAAIAFIQLPQWWQAIVFTKMIRRSLEKGETDVANPHLSTEV